MMAAPLKAYFDESYNQPNPKRPHEPLIYSVGCWLSTVEKWRRFGKRWRRVLRDAGIDDFHMNKYESRIRPYNDWSDRKRVAVLQKLWKSVGDYAMFGCIPMVHRADWDAFIQARPYLRNQFGKTPYGFCAQAAIGMINDWCDKRNLDGPIEYIFAHLPGQGGALDYIFNTLLKDKEAKKAYRLSGMWQKGRARKVSQLQGADLLAYEFTKRVTNQLSPQPNPIRKATLYMSSIGFSDYNFDGIYFNKTKLNNWGDDVVKANVPLALWH